MKVVINKCFGGFGLSNEAIIELIKRDAITGIPEEKYYGQNYSPEKVLEDYSEDLGDGYRVQRWGSSVLKDGKIYYPREMDRTDKNLIAVVEELGEKADGPHAQLGIVDIPKGVDWEIDDYDGNECVRERSRSWS